MELFGTATRKVYKVSEVTAIVKNTLESSSISTLWVEGEVSNFKRHTSGHLYFTLKDASSQIQCVIFRAAANQLRFALENGISIVLFGNITVYAPRGNYQIVGTRAEPLGLGALQLAFEQLKKRLEAEGLFDEAHKKSIPLVPERIGVITSPTGAAIRDILNVINRRFANVSVLIHPANVQGDKAAGEIAMAINTMNQIGGLDVLIVGRGGGSMEDLWAFNEEVVVRSIYASEIPVISAVGHEIDFTMSDFVADYRAPTPSAAAELVVANKAELSKRLEGFNTRLRSSMSSRTKLLRSRIDGAERRLLLRDGRDKIHLFQQSMDDLLSRAQMVLNRFIEQRRDIVNLEQRSTASMQNLFGLKKEKFRTVIAKLDALSPLAILQRGYSVCFQHPSRKVIKNTSEVSAGDKVEVKLSDGEIICEVERVFSEFLF